MSDDVVACNRGHDSSLVVRAGIQRTGGREKQRWKCTTPEGAHHIFVGALARTRTHDGTCRECENHIAAHQGPTAPAEGEYLVREIAEALVDVGRGRTYTDAAKRARMAANHGKTAARREIINGQTVADWMADYAPAVAARHEETMWPAVLVLDSTTFRWTDPASGKSLFLFWIFAAYGYDKEGKRGKLWKVKASPVGGIDAWAEFLESLPGKPESIVCDQDNSIRGGVEKRWGQWAAVNLIHHCEHHLSERAKAEMKSDGVAANDPLRQLFRGFLQTKEAWGAFEAEVESRPTLMLTNKWLKRNQVHLRVQTHSRSQIPPVYSNGAVEQPLRVLREHLEPRTFMLRNRARMDNLLELMRLAYLRADDVHQYSADIRAYIEANDGHPDRTYRDTYDQKLDDDGEARFNSLWSTEAQLAMKEARRRRAIAKARELEELGHVDLATGEIT